jgi:hypothetical protein
VTRHPFLTIGLECNRWPHRDRPGMVARGEPTGEFLN